MKIVVWNPPGFLSPILRKFFKIGKTQKKEQQIKD